MTLIGQKAVVTVGPCSGKIGSITRAYGRDTDHSVPVEYRIEFTPAAHVPAAGYLTAVWRRADQFNVLQ